MELVVVAGAFTLIGAFVSAIGPAMLSASEARRRGRSAIGLLLVEIARAESAMSTLSGDAGFGAFAVEDDAMPDFSLLQRRFDDFANVVPVGEMVETIQFMDATDQLLRMLNQRLRASMRTERISLEDPDPTILKPLEAIGERLAKQTGRMSAHHTLANSFVWKLTHWKAWRQARDTLS